MLATGGHDTSLTAEIVAGLMEVYEGPVEKPQEAPRLLGAAQAQNGGGPAPASDPRSDLSEQTAQSPGGTPKASGQSPRQEPSKAAAAAAKS